MAQGCREQLLIGGIFIGGGLLTMAVLYGYTELSEPAMGIEGATHDKGIVEPGLMPSLENGIPTISPDVGGVYVDINGCVTNCEIGHFAGKSGEFCIYDGVPGVIPIPNIPEGRVGASPGYCPVPGGGSIPVTGQLEQNLSPRLFVPDARQLIATATPVTGTIYNSNQNQKPQDMKCIEVGGVARWASRHDSREAIDPSNCNR